MLESQEKNKTIREELIIALIQTLIFGAILLLFGYWLNVRLETTKQQLTSETEKLKVMLATNDPIIQQRKSLYLDYRSAIFNLNNTLIIYYHLADTPDSEVALSNQISALRTALQPEMGSGASGSWRTPDDVIQAIQAIVTLRLKDQLLLPRTFNEAIDTLIKSVTDDLIGGELPQNHTKNYQTYAVKRLQKVCNDLNETIERAVGI